MTILGGIGFTAPWLLLGLIVLPVLWFILRAVPPAPLRRRFPGVALLLGLTDDDTVTDRTPWWLLLLRMLAVAAMILGLAGPVLNPSQQADAGSGPLLVVVDGSWAGAPGWVRAKEAALTQLAKASSRNRAAALLVLTDPNPPVFQTADSIVERLAALQPKPWQPSPGMIAETQRLIGDLDPFDTLWLSDGLRYEGHADLLEAFENKGNIIALQGGLTPIGIQPARYADGLVTMQVVRPDAGPERSATVLAQGTDPAGNAAILARAGATFENGETSAEIQMALPAELRGRVTRFTLEGVRSAGATTLVDDSLRRREVALIAGREDREGLQLLQPLHYLEQALDPYVDLLRAPLQDVLPANPDVVVLADVAVLSSAESQALIEWVEKGGMLLRFAGPRVAASDISRAEEDALMPVRLRSGGRSVGGAMSWGEPKALAPFVETSPFFGLDLPEDVRITAQVMAQPDPQLADRVIAELTDGTPLVTRKDIGLGQVVLFHVTANAEWSNLPLSVLFVEMLERLSVVSGVSTPNAEDLEGTTWSATKVLDAFGTVRDAPNLPGIAGPDLVTADLGPDLPPGIYQMENRALARNVLNEDTQLTAITWPGSVTVLGLASQREVPLTGLLLAAALLMLMADIVASLALSGRLNGPRAAQVSMLVGVFFLVSPPADADDAFALLATNEIALAHVITGDEKLDDVAHAGLRGLSETLFFRTSIEPSDPIGVNLEVDELAFFPILYWPITPDQPRPSTEAYAKLNAYLRSGGLILFDTRDADLARFGAGSPNGRKLQQLAAPLDIPRLEPVPSDHVLTRTFYLLQDFPGRHTGRELWVEAAPPDAETIDGMPFRNLNDGVTPVVIGGNDWASAWAVTRTGAPLLPVGRGFSGERQRELAYRFGVNLVMHVLTGNYKSDQVHVPALLDRLGQ
ncbi:MAG: DUF4159 domain-containing protein [Paracoccaceae bacterium]